MVELIIRDSLGSGSFSTSAPTSPVGPSAPPYGERAPSSQVRAPAGPVERQSSFPKSYVESSHRREWFERLDRARENDVVNAPQSENTPAYDDEHAAMEEDEVITLERGNSPVLCDCFVWLDNGDNRSFDLGSNILT